MGSETELKFRVFEKDPGEIIDAILKDSEIISKETHKLTNEYYDTEDLQLMRSRSGFRVRSTDGVYEETVKTSGRSGGGLATRKEFNIPLKDPRPDLSLFPPEAFPFETENLEEVSKGLKKLFSSDVERTSWLVKSASGTSEISLDLGAVKSGNLTDEIREVEIELKDGAEKAIFETAEKIINSGKITLRAESRSKAQRGYILAGLSPEPEYKDLDAGKFQSSLYETDILRNAWNRYLSVEALLDHDPQGSLKIYRAMWEALELIEGASGRLMLGEKLGTLHFIESLSWVGRHRVLEETYAATGNDLCRVRMEEILEEGKSRVHAMRKDPKYLLWQLRMMRWMENPMAFAPGRG